MADHGLWIVVAYTGLAGLAIPAGAWAAHVEHLRPAHLHRDFVNFVMAFGGGALLAAVALVLVPEGARTVSTAVAATLFGSGAIVFLVVDRLIEKAGGRAGQFIGMLMDFVPESVALGAAVAAGGATGPLLALLIGLQNLPEGFSSYRETRASGMAASHSLSFLSPLALLGPAGGVAGFLWLAGRPDLVGGIMLFAAGGILYLVFHDIIPQAHRRGHWIPTLGGILGFLIGLVAAMTINGP